jgi:hypothetical protein
VTVTGTMPDGLTATTLVSVTPPIPVGILVRPDPAAGLAGRPTTFTATITLSDRTQVDVTADAYWWSDGPGRFDAPGVFVPAQGGSWPIHASFGGLDGWALIEVPPAFIRLDLSYPPAEIVQGDTVQFSAWGTLDDGQAYDVTATSTWSASPAEAVATGVPGQFRFDGAGFFEITAVSPDGLVTVPLAVHVWTAPTTLEILPAVLSVDQGTDAVFGAVLHYADGSSEPVGASWELGNPALGVPLAPGAWRTNTTGTSLVTATWTGLGRTVVGTATLTVRPVPVGIKVSPIDVAVRFGTVQTFQALATMSDGTEVDVTADAVWQIASGTAAAVVGPGAFEAVGVGASVVSATLVSAGLQNQALFRTTFAGLRISPAASTVANGGTVVFFVLSDFKGAIRDATAFAAFSSSSPGVATFLPGGRTATATGSGTTTISALMADGTVLQTTLTVP